MQPLQISAESRCLGRLGYVVSILDSTFLEFFRTDVAFSGFMGACGARPGAEQKQPKHVHPCLFPMYVVKVQRDMNGHDQLLVRFI